MVDLCAYIALMCLCIESFIIITEEIEKQIGGGKCAFRGKDLTLAMIGETKARRKTRKVCKRVTRNIIFPNVKCTML